MKKARRVILWAAVCGVLALAFFTPEQSAGLRRRELLRQRYGGWAGVLRLWVFQGWEGGGSLAAWLNEGIAAFEKLHGGVYIQLTEVSAAALRNFAEGPANPPDMILFPPGLLESPAHLAALPEASALRAGLEACGVLGEERFALPVALGVYGLVCNRAAFQTPPADWHALPETPALKGCEYWLDWPADGMYLRWSRAMETLLAPAPADEAAPESPRAGEGLDLGLPASAMASRLPRRLPAEFGRQASVYKRFVNGEIAAMPATQREITRLRRLSESGRGPDWIAAARVSAYTDQIALLAVTDCARSALADRQALCRAFAALLLREDIQGKLTKAGAFPAISLPPLYAASQGMAQLEAALAELTLRPEAAFAGA